MNNLEIYTAIAVLAKAEKAVADEQFADEIRQAINFFTRLHTALDRLIETHDKGQLSSTPGDSYCVQRIKLIMQGYQ